MVEHHDEKQNVNVFNLMILVITAICPRTDSPFP
jgi:hypothetical protein